MTLPIPRSSPRPLRPRRASASWAAARPSRKDSSSASRNSRSSAPPASGDTLRISVFKAAKYGDFGIINGEVFRGTELIARGEVKVFQSDNGTVAK